MFRNAVQQLIAGSLSRREFVTALGALGIGTVAAGRFADALGARPDIPATVELNFAGDGREMVKHAR